jgi:membrane protein YqaA with SNARE-associated domain
LIGYGLWHSIGERLVELYGCAESFAAYRELVQQWGVPIIIGKAFTPIPFKIAAIAAGVAAMDPLSFLVAAVVGRTLHFGMVGVLLTVCGERTVALITRYERPLAIISIVALIGIAAAWFML